MKNILIAASIVLSVMAAAAAFLLKKRLDKSDTTF